MRDFVCSVKCESEGKDKKQKSTIQIDSTLSRRVEWRKRSEPKVNIKLVCKWNRQKVKRERQRKQLRALLNEKQTNAKQVVSSLLLFVNLRIKKLVQKRTTFLIEIVSTTSRMWAGKLDFFIFVDHFNVDQERNCSVALISRLGFVYEFFESIWSE